MKQQLFTEQDRQKQHPTLAQLKSKFRVNWAQVLRHGTSSHIRSLVTFDHRTHAAFHLEVSLRLNSSPFLKLSWESQSERTDESCKESAAKVDAGLDPVRFHHHHHQGTIEVNIAQWCLMAIRPQRAISSLNCENICDTTDLLASVKHLQRNDSTK